MLIFEALAAFAGVLLVYAGVTEKFALSLQNRSDIEPRVLGILNPLAIVLGVCVVISSVFD